MILRVDGTRRRGPAVDARDLPVRPRDLHAAVRDPDDDRLTCPAPGPVHEHVGIVHPESTRPSRTALAAAARSRGATTPFDEQVADLRAELADVDPPSVDVPAAVRAVADAASDVESLRDRVARLGGIVAARQDADAIAAAQADLRTAAADLAEAETAHHAARQELARERDRQRAANDARERRLRCRDRLENRQRDARRHLAERESPRLVHALDALPDWPNADDGARHALAAARIAAVRAPVVLVDGPFRTPAQARACLDAPVVLASGP